MKIVGEVSYTLLDAIFMFKQAKILSTPVFQKTYSHASSALYLCVVLSHAAKHADVANLLEVLQGLYGPWSYKPYVVLGRIHMLV